MKISEALDIHAGLLQLAGGPKMPAKLGIYTDIVVENIILFEQRVVNKFREDQQQIVFSCGADKVPDKDASDEEKALFEFKVEEANKRIMAMVNEETEVAFHAIPRRILSSDIETMTAGVARLIFPILKGKGN